MKYSSLGMRILVATDKWLVFIGREVSGYRESKCYTKRYDIEDLGVSPCFRPQYLVLVDMNFMLDPSPQESLDCTRPNK